MRADRLVAILMLLQVRGRVTAAEVAAELEVSERTARRDLDALAVAGIPIYSQQGRGGGWSLIGGARTDLTGLTAAEARALFLVAGPRSNTTPELQAALRKLVAALPEPFQHSAVAASESIMVDAADWGRTAVADPDHLDVVQSGIVEQRRVRLAYSSRTSGSTERIIEPLGLVAKGPRWYLLADTERGERLFRVDRIVSAHLTEEHFERPAGFDLAAAWTEVSAGIETYRSRVRAHGWVQPEIIALTRMVIGERLTDYGLDETGRHRVAIGGQASEEIAAIVAGFGAGVEIETPDEVRAELARVGSQLVALYGV